MKAKLSNLGERQARLVVANRTNVPVAFRNRGIEIAPTLETTRVSSKTAGLRHGYKHVFFIESNDQLHVRDAAANGQELDLVSEAKRERAIRFVLGAAYRVAAGVHKKGGTSDRKFDALVAEASKLELATTHEELTVTMRIIARSPAATIHRSKLGFGGTRSQITSERLVAELERRPVALLPLPDLASDSLGL